ncbi:hypothetical protein [Achromobacter ruhlandii]|uniref:hypothetical protein n=1 Tax=Achromobacter ruhlandii TaxID=72557 RepID=UPI003B9BF475
MKRHYRVGATRRKQAGFTVLEALLVTLLFAAVMGLWNWYQADYVATITSRQAAFHQKQVGNAAAAYVKNNYAALLTSPWLRMSRPESGMSPDVDCDTAIFCAMS